MSMQTDYREQVNRMCEQTELPDGKEMLEMAKNYAATGTGGAAMPRRRIRMLRKGIFIAAACATAAGLTAIGAGAAGYGPLSGLFREKFRDETTADLIDQGYLYEINQSFTDGIYRADLIAVSGDLENPKLIIDLYIDDPDIAAANKTVSIGVYTLGVYQYEHELDQYTWADGTAFRDSEIPNLYHASIQGAPVWMSHGKECVIDITAIYRNEPDGTPVIDRTHMETRLTIPTDELADTDCLYYTDEDNMVLSYNGIDYMLTCAQFSAYQTEISFRLCMDEFLANAPEDAQEDTCLFKDAALNEALVLTVDGTAYSCDPDCCYIWWDAENECDDPEFGYETPLFAHIDFASAQNIVLSAGDASLTLKGSSDFVDANDATAGRNDEVSSQADSAPDTDEQADKKEDQTDSGSTDAMTYAYHTPLWFAKEDHAVLHFRDHEYQLTHVFFLETGTEIGLCYDADSDDDAALHEALTLIIDGEAYSCMPDCGYTWFDTEEQSVTGKRGYVNPIFPAFSFDAAKTVVLSVGDTSYTLKGTPVTE